MKISCTAPKVSAYNFMRYLCACLAIEKNVILDLHRIVDKIYAFRQSVGSEYPLLFEDIEFRASADSVVSYDINEGINNLQTFGVIGKLNPTYEKIVIYLSKEESEKILQTCDETVREAMTRLANTF